MKKFIIVFIFMISITLINSSVVYGAVINQQWNSYSDSPVDLCEYPYQAIVTNSSGTFLAMATSKLHSWNLNVYAYNAYLNQSISGKCAISQWNGTAWGSVTYYTNRMDLVFKPSDTSFTVKESNCDIYSDSTLTSVYFSKTVLLPKEVNGSPIWLRFVAPEDNKITARNIVNYKIEGRIKGDCLNTTYILTNGNGVTLDQDSNILKADVLTTKKFQDGDYTYISFDVNVLYYKDLGTQTLKVKLMNSTSNTYINTSKTIQRVSFLDIDNDGKDDNTQEQVYDNPSEYLGNEDIENAPNKADYEDSVIGSINYLADTVIYYITLPFKFLGSLFTQVTKFLSSAGTWFGDSTHGVIGFMTSIFSFLPKEVSIIIGGLLAFTVIFSVLKMIRS